MNKSVLILIITSFIGLFVISSVIYFAIGAIANNKESEIKTIGVLSVVTNCMIPEGCGPKYNLENSEFKSSIPLIGDMNDDDSELIISVIGTKTTLSDSESGSMNNGKKIEAIKVKSYEVISKVKYHDFLVTKAGEYTLKNYPCLASKEYDDSIATTYNKSFSWEINGDTPIIKVRMTNTMGEINTDSYYEIWYNANSGDFIKEINEPKNIVFCN